MISLMTGQFFRSEVKAVLTSQAMWALGYRRRMRLAVGKAWMMSPRLLGLRMRIRRGSGGLPAILQPFGEGKRQAGGADFRLGCSDVVVETVEFDKIFVEVESDVGSLRLSVAWLADGADVDAIFAGDFDFDARVQTGLNAGGAAHEADWNVSVTVEADLSLLTVETVGGGEFVENVGPFVRQVERGVDDGKTLDLPDVFKVAQPSALVFAQLFARPFDSFSGERIETGQVDVAGAIFVVVAHDGWAIEFPD